MPVLAVSQSTPPLKADVGGIGGSDGSLHESRILADMTRSCGLEGLLDVRDGEPESTKVSSEAELEIDALRDLEIALTDLRTVAIIGIRDTMSVRAYKPEIDATFVNRPLWLKTAGAWKG